MMVTTMRSEYNVLSRTRKALERNQFKVLVASSKRDLLTRF